MNIPKQILVSSKTGHLIFSDATPSQLKSKGKDFNSGQIRVVDNIISSLTIKKVAGATGRGASSVSFEVDCIIGNEPNRVDKTLFISSDDMLKIMGGTNVKGLVIEGQFVAVFRGLTYILEPYTSNTFNKEEELANRKEEARLEALNKRKQLRVANQGILSTAVKGSILEIEGKKVVYMGHGYVSYLQNRQEKEPQVITKKSHIVMARGYKDCLTVALLDISSMELTLTGEVYPVEQALEENREYIKWYARSLRRGSQDRYLSMYQKYEKLYVALGLELTVASMGDSKDESINLFNLAQSTIDYDGSTVPEEFWEGIRDMKHLKGTLGYLNGV